MNRLVITNCDILVNVGINMGIDKARSVAQQQEEKKELDDTLKNQ
jgi:hypothetical protein